MRITFLLIIASVLSTTVLAQDSSQQGDSLGIDTGQTIIDLEPGTLLEDGTGIFIPVPYPGQPTPKAPARPRYVGLSGHTLFTGGLFDGYTLFVIDGANSIVYSADLWADEQSVTLPEWLTGAYTIAFVHDDGSCYYGEIEL